MKKPPAWCEHAFGDRADFTLEDALDRAAFRWLGRRTLERERLTLAQAQLAAVALRALEDAPATAATTLRSVVCPAA